MSNSIRDKHWAGAMRFRNHVVRGRWLLIAALTVSVAASLMHGRDYTKPPPFTVISQGR